MPGLFELPGDLLVWWFVAIAIGAAGLVVLVLIVAKLILLLVLFGHEDPDLDEVTR